MSNRTKTIISMVSVGIVVGTVAANFAPKDENRLFHGLSWGGGSAALTGVVGMYVFDDQKVHDELERKLLVTKRELDAFRGESESSAQQVELVNEPGLSRELPQEYKGLVKPGGWSVYKINSWVSQGENSLVHQDKVIRINPPQFQSPSQLIKTEEIK